MRPQYGPYHTSRGDPYHTSKGTRRPGCFVRRVRGSSYIAARSEGSSTDSGFQIRLLRSLAKYKTWTFETMKLPVRCWPKRKCQMHQLIIVKPRFLRWTTISAAVSSGIFTQKEPWSFKTRK